MRQLPTEHEINIKTNTDSAS